LPGPSLSSSSLETALQLQHGHIATGTNAGLFNYRTDRSIAQHNFN